jgi:ABC-2 type transport system permease protein
MGKYIKIMSISMKNSTIYLRDFIMSNSFIILIITVYILLWGNLYSQNVKTGFSFKELIWYLIINQIVFSNNMDLFRQIENDIKSGNIAYHFNKPYSYPAFIFFDSLGKVFLRFAVNMFFGILLGMIFIGSLPVFKLINIIPILVMMCLGITLNLIIYILISLTSFWLEENKPFIWIYRQFIFAFGGFLLPLTLFPEKLYKLMINMPWTYVSYHTSNSIVHFNPKLFFTTVAWQLSYIALFSVLVYFVFRKGAEALNVNGG